MVIKRIRIDARVAKAKKQGNRERISDKTGRFCNGLRRTE